VKRSAYRWSLSIAVATILSAAAPGNAQDVGYGYLTVCNKGTVAISVVSALEDRDFGYRLDVSGWWALSPGDCQVVVRRQGFDGYSGERAAPAYVGFAFFDAQHQGTAGRIDSAPDLGKWQNNWFQAMTSGVMEGPVLTRSSKTLCVHRAQMGYRQTSESANCATLHAEGDAGPFFPLSAALRFEPVVSWYSSATNEMVGGDYYLDVAPRPNDLELHASAGSAREHDGSDVAEDSSDDSDLLKQFMIAVAEAKERADAEKKAEEAARLEANRKVLEARRTDPVWIAYEQQQQQKWGAPRASPGDYSAAWNGKQMHVSGTVAEVSVVEGHPSWLTVRFRESPSGAFVVCSPSPSIFTGLFGDDLNAIVGKQIEVIGEVESPPYCRGTAGNIRVLDSDGVRMLEAP